MKKTLKIRHKKTLKKTLKKTHKTKHMKKTLKMDKIKITIIYKKIL